MPRTKPLPQREQEICKRLVEFRTLRGLKRSDVARVMGINESTLANIEKVRTPLRIGMAFNLGRKYNISLRWLASGKRPMKTFTPILQRIMNSINPSDLFSDVYDRVLKNLVLAELQKGADACGTTLEGLDEREFVSFHPAGGGAVEGHLDQVVAMLRAEFEKMDEDRQMRLVRRLIDVPESVWKNLEVHYSGVLTDAETFDKSSHVKPQMPILLERLKKATAGPGMKTALADFLSAPLASVSRWLSGEREPGGEIALQMLRWVEQQERKQ